MLQTGSLTSVLPVFSELVFSEFMSLGSLARVPVKEFCQFVIGALRLLVVA